MSDEINEKSIIPDYSSTTASKTFVSSGAFISNTGVPNIQGSSYYINGDLSIEDMMATLKTFMAERMIGIKADLAALSNRYTDLEDELARLDNNTKELDKILSILETKTKGEVT